MRMWLSDPRYMCRRHLMGEHLELHMFLGTLERGRSVQGFIDNNLFEPKALSIRHRELRIEIRNRGYKHQSILLRSRVRKALLLLPKQQLNTSIDRKRSLSELHSRCIECRELYRGEKDV